MTRTSLALALLLAPSIVWSQDDPVRRALINQAAEARDRGDHVQALALAREAASRRMSPSLRTFIAQEYLDLGQRGLALDHARTCVREIEADASLANRQTLLAECRALVGRLTPAPTPPPPPPPPPYAVAPAVPAPPPVQEAPREAQRSSGPGVGPWVVMGAGALSFVAAGVFYALREAALRERSAWCGSQNPCFLPTTFAVEEARGTQERADTYNTLTNVAFGVGSAAVAGGVLWFIAGRSGSNDPPRATLLVAPRRDGVYLGAQWPL